MFNKKINFIKTIILFIGVILLSACGGTSSSDTESDLTEDVNSKPTIYTTLPDIIMDHNSTKVIKIFTNDTDGDNLTIKIDTNDSNLKVHKNFTNPLLQGDYHGVQLDFTLSSDYNVSKTVEVTITINDEESEIVKSFNVEIIRVFSSGESWQGKIYNTVISPHTSRIWLDRNLGASMVCTKGRNDSNASFTDISYTASQKDCFGDYYQFGRNTDGHEKSDSNLTSIKANNILSVGHSSFITSSSTYDFDWAKDIDVSGDDRRENWKKSDGTSICPEGFKVPSSTELENETVELSGNDEVEYREDAFKSFLKFPTSGMRNNGTGSIYGLGERASIWSHTDNYEYSIALFFDNSDAEMQNGAYRATGRSVRCIKAE